MRELLTDAPCRVCSHPDAIRILDARDHREGMPGDFSVVQCESCGVCRVDPWPVDPMAWYPTAYQQHSAQTATGKVVEWAVRTANAPKTPGVRRRVLARVVPDCDLGGASSPGARVLDVGAGNGAAVRGLQASGIDAVGIEPDSAAVEAAHEGGASTVAQGTLDENPFAGESFDVVRMYQVLEHVPDPVDAVRSAASLLAPDGRLLIGVPNFGSLGRRLFSGSWDGLELPRHLHHFTRSSLSTVLRRGGLEPVQIHTVALFGLLPASFDARSTGGTRQRGWGKNVPLRAAAYPVELMAGALGGGDGLMAVAQRSG